MLKTKGLPPAPIGTKVAEEALKSRESTSKRWTEYDHFIETDEEEIEEKHIVQEIMLPG